MSLFYPIEVATAGTKEWEARTHNLTITANLQTTVLGVPSSSTAVPPVPVIEPEPEPRFGTHIRETVEAAKRLLAW